MYFLLKTQDPDDGADIRVMNHLASDPSITFTRSDRLDELAGFGEDTTTEIIHRETRYEQRGEDFNYQYREYMTRYNTPFNLMRMDTFNVPNFPEDVESLFNNFPRDSMQEQAELEEVVPRKMIKERRAGDKKLRSLKYVTADMEIEPIDKGVRVRCAECVGLINDDKKSKEDHAISHTSIKRYECAVANCKKQTGCYSEIKEHHKEKHKDEMMTVKQLGLTADEKDELNAKHDKCFPQQRKPKSKKAAKHSFECQICHKVIGSNHRHGNSQKKVHAVTHCNIMLFKCPHTGCKFETKTMIEMVSHRKKSHKKDNNARTIDIKLTDKRKKEIVDMIKKCFPPVSSDEAEEVDDDVIIDEEDQMEDDDVQIVDESDEMIKAKKKR